MKKTHNEHCEYDRESDVLDVYFGEKQRSWTIELTDNIMISIDRQAGAAVALCFLDFTRLIRITPFGPPSFPITGLADLPIAERDQVLEIVTSPPVCRWLDISAVQELPDSPFAVAHLEPPPRRILELIAA